MSANDISAENLQHVIFPWSKQGGLSPRVFARGEGVYFWDGDGKRYIDFASQLVCLNLGHQHPRVAAAIKEAADAMCYASPPFATDAKGRLGAMIAEVTPGDLSKTLFTGGGAEATEYAIKIARLVTGRPKIIARNRSYHGATYGAMSLTGDYRRAYNEPGMPGALHCFSPYCYRCVFGQKPETCGRECVSSIEEMILSENPEFIGAIIVESITGPSNGLYVPPDDYFLRLRALCDKYDILLIADEIMAGWGRTGKWFAIEHFDVVPDIMVIGKGVTNGMVPLGGVVVNRKVADLLEDRVLWAGSTYCGHPLACATGIAAVNVYREDRVIENSREMGEILTEELQKFKAKHPSVGDVRGKGLFMAIELVSDRGSRAPLVPMAGPQAKGGGSGGVYAVAGAMATVRDTIEAGGVYTLTRPNLIAITPPLIITKEQLLEGLDAIDKALSVADEFAGSVAESAAE